ncbi:hypothetical protein C1H46_003051 [Malus baccata]|uniref:Uncharacterized protein n=1 Tax=Malus baccata TaxID=106549 RepID=A0A540NJU0_MALBA|nr:hypothetical protein C1H46_003051 [Malus baccata]
MNPILGQWAVGVSGEGVKSSIEILGGKKKGASLSILCCNPALAAFLYFPKIHEQTTQSSKDLTDTVFEFPERKSPLKAIHMIEPVLDQDNPAYWDFLFFCSYLPKSKGIIVNMFEELGPLAILHAIDEGLCNKC